MLLVASGDESETFIGLPRVCPDLTLYIDDAGMFVISGLRFPGIVLRISCFHHHKRLIISLNNTISTNEEERLGERLRTMCLIAISRDFLESDLPNPALSGDEDFADKLP